MDIAVINPNSSAAMTARIAQSISRYKAPATHLRVLRVETAPISIQGHFDEAACLPGLLDAVTQQERLGVDGIVVACFDDPGVGACREIATGPVIGICEAAVVFAKTVAANFSIVTTLPRSVPIVEELVVKYGAERQCRQVRAADIPVISLEEDPDRARKAVRSEIEKAIAQDRCEAIILGCAGMSDLAEELTRTCGRPVIDGCVAGLKMIEGIVGAGIVTSKAGAFDYPIGRELVGSGAGRGCVPA
ncbi:aspartate/glutamate racemase family protein [Pseudaminobacter arsenicus]|uniref:Aspartate/glutamate racemase family protein n=1 Tax=Borborobacter arsenicus TaxID=1851146 RepID=A0A432V7F9_9HYPH|nr:aspartate/glutamate racemase family protein [Pseudaminobacter arsenicus]RUM98104.1 aspartate/glutamate racemase family protein [Pseudaminobacter arsenicus]